MIRSLAVPSLIAAACSSPVAAAEARSFEIPALPLDQALMRLGEQAGVSVGGSDPRISLARSKPVSGKMTLANALRKMLRGSGLTFVLVDSRTVRIIAAPPERQRQLKPLVRAKSQLQPKELAVRDPVSVPEPKEIVVTASKQSQPLSRYPGTARVEQIGAPGLNAERGTAALVGRLPELSSTNLGPGRNKLFIRGISDSSFSGPTQSTVGLYLGDMRLTYNAPDPDLRFYDVERIEIIEGPQGTLYGAGVLGGIVRIMPNRPDHEKFAARASLGSTHTDRGAPGYDVEGMINVPLWKDRVALRVVGYEQVEGGYIDNPQLGQRNTNRTTIDGARISLEIDPGDAWRLSAMGVIQNLDTRDGQYAQRSLPKLSHNAAISQPHDNDFRGLNVVIGKSWRELELTSSFSIIDHILDERFDPARVAGPASAFDRVSRYKMLVHETRLASRPGAWISWVGGIGYTDSRDRTEQFLGELPDPPRISSVQSEKSEIALFGEATVPVSERLSITGGSRVVRAQVSGEIVGNEAEPTRRQWRVLPTAALSWRPHGRLQAFARVQTGFRSGGLAIDQAGSTNRFESDQIYTAEAGVRFGDASQILSTPISGSATIFHTGWSDIQADLLDINGLPTTLNIGNGHIDGVQAAVNWRPNQELSFEGAAFVNRSRLDNPSAELMDLDNIPLPNIPRYGGRLSVRWARQLSAGLTFQTDAIIRYRSGSNVGTLPPLLLEQGEYAEADLAAMLRSESWQLTLDLTNVFNARKNSFAFGNPFTASLGDQITPLRPRSLRVGISFGF
jgi:iron complex outermembrane recepter protein